MHTDQCRNCGTALQGPFCSACGQPEADGHPPTIKHFSHDLVHELGHVDGKIVRTLKALFGEPGRLTEEYWAGRVVSWVRPIRIFLIVAALHLLFSRGVGPLNYEVHLERSPNGELNVNVSGNLSKNEHKPGFTAVPEDERREFFAHFEKTYAAIRYGAVLVFALALWALYRRRQPYFVNHLIAGLHFYSFWYALALAASLASSLLPVLNAVSLFSVVYLFLMLRRLFSEKWFVCLGKTAALYVVMLATELGLGLSAASFASRVGR